MNQSDLNISQFARLVIDALENAKVTYLIGGSLALIAWGQIRSTQDVDFVVELHDFQLEALSDELAKIGMMVPPDIMADLINETRIDIAINAIHPFTGYKAEFYPVRPDDKLRKLAIARRQQIDMGPELGSVYVHSPEDLILYKLKYYSISRQTKHTRDIASILSSDLELDIDYIEHWAKELSLADLWIEINKG